ncbi:thioredoxin C-2 [unidentified eubacterium SCB49]|nr:thioredoxin C-2 [unidentified eubacterium SCB49]
MSKFGELLDTQVPVLLDFYTDRDDVCVQMRPVLREVAAALSDKARVIKIDVDKNTELIQALRVKTVPTLMIYKDSEMKWRQSGMLDAATLVNQLKKYI